MLTNVIAAIIVGITMIAITRIKRQPMQMRYDKSTLMPSKPYFTPKW